MNAREMFESLGYKYSEDYNEDYDFKTIEYYKGENTRFLFWINAREFYAGYCEEPK